MSSVERDNIMPRVFRALADATEDQLDVVLQILEGNLCPADYVEPYITLKEVSCRLGIHTSTLARWNVPGYSVNGRTRYLLSEVNAFIREKGRRGS